MWSHVSGSPNGTVRGVRSRTSCPGSTWCLTARRDRIRCRPTMRSSNWSREAHNPGSWPGSNPAPSCGRSSAPTPTSSTKQPPSTGRSGTSCGSGAGNPLQTWSGACSWPHALRPKRTTFAADLHASSSITSPRPGPNASWNQIAGSHARCLPTAGANCSATKNDPGLGCLFGTWRMHPRGPDFPTAGACGRPSQIRFGATMEPPVEPSTAFKNVPKIGYRIMP